MDKQELITELMRLQLSGDGHIEDLGGKKLLRYKTLRFYKKDGQVQMAININGKDLFETPLTGSMQTDFEHGDSLTIEFGANHYMEINLA